MPLLVAVVTTPGAEGYQNRYLDPTTVDVPLPFLTFDLVGFVLLFGLGYLVLSARRSPASMGLLALLAGAYVWIVLGYVGILVDVPLLTGKAVPVIQYTLVVGAAAGAVMIGRQIAANAEVRRRIGTTGLVLVLGGGAVVVATALGQDAINAIPYVKEQREAVRPTRLLTEFTRGDPWRLRRHRRPHRRRAASGAATRLRVQRVERGRREPRAPSSTSARGSSSASARRTTLPCSQLRSHATATTTSTRSRSAPAMATTSPTPSSTTPSRVVCRNVCSGSTSDQFDDAWFRRVDGSELTVFIPRGRSFTRPRRRPTPRAAYPLRRRSRRRRRSGSGLDEAEVAVVAPVEQRGASVLGVGEEEEGVTEQRPSGARPPRDPSASWRSACASRCAARRATSSSRSSSAGLAPLPFRCPLPWRTWLRGRRRSLMRAS